MLNFPDAPTTNQTFTGSYGTYKWDGTKWIPTSAFTDAPSDGSLYGRLNSTWTKAVPLAGGTMTGLLTLSGDPTVALGAVTKQYSDTKVPLAGGTMTGLLTLSANPTANLGAATKQYVDGLVTTYATPTASLGLTAIAGSATTAMRSDAAPALSVSIAPTWTAWHSFNAGMRSSGQTPPASGAGLELLWNGTNSVLQSYDRGAGAFKGLLLQGLSITTNVGMTIAGLTDVNGTIRSKAQTNPSSGAGLEVIYNGTAGYLQCLDWAGPTWKTINIQGANYVFTVVTGGNGNVAIQSSAASSAYNTGALTVAGGVGIGGALNTNAGANIGGNVSINGTIGATQYNNGNGTVAALSPSATLNSSYNQLYDSSNRVAVILGGTNDSQNYYRNNQHNFQNVGGGTPYTYITATGTAIYPTTASSSTTTGALTVGGGAGIAGVLYALQINGRNAGTWAGGFVNTTVATGQAGIFVGAGSTPATNDTTTIFCAWADPAISAYCGYVYRNGPNACAYGTGSDATRKTTVNEYSLRGLDVLRRIKVRDFYWNNDKEKIVVQGLYAQELQEDYLEAVGHPPMLDADGKPTGEIAWGIDYGRLTPLLTRAIQQLADKVDRLEARVEALEAA